MRPQKPIWKKIRHPLPRKVGGPHSTPKGKRGYSRNSSKIEARKRIEESLASMK